MKIHNKDLSTEVSLPATKRSRSCCDERLCFFPQSVLRPRFFSRATTLEVEDVLAALASGH